MRSNFPCLNLIGNANSTDQTARGTGSREDKVSCLVDQIERQQNEGIVKSNAGLVVLVTELDD